MNNINMKLGKTVLITGGTSGIGLALAVCYLQKGYRVIITGRTASKVDGVIEQLKEYPNFLGGYLADVTNAVKMEELINTLDEKYPLDIVIANAGISSGISGTRLNMQENNLSNIYLEQSKLLQKQAQEIFDTNVMGVFNTVHPVIAKMRTRKVGQVVIISSLSAFFGFKSAIFYASSKAAVKSYAEGLRLFLKDSNVGVCAVFPGFVKSNITDSNKFKMPYLMSGEKAAEIIIKGIQKNKGFIAFPKKMYIWVYLISILPYCWREKLLSKLPNK